VFSFSIRSALGPQAAAAAHSGPAQATKPKIISERAIPANPTAAKFGVRGLIATRYLDQGERI
jgi:hypothetical protein